MICCWVVTVAEELFEIVYQGKATEPAPVSIILFLWCMNVLNKRQLSCKLFLLLLRKVIHFTKNIMSGLYGIQELWESINAVRVTC